MRVLSLFDGIACGRVALERAGFSVDRYYSSEIDKFAISIAQKNYPDIIQLGDVRNIDFEQFVGKIDIIIGGSPCTDLSVSNHQRQGLAGKHSSLFWDYLRALTVIRPKYFLLENVASMSAANRKVITEALQALYPDTEHTMIDSALLSAQMRKRYYWYNWHVDMPVDQGVTIQDILDRDISTEFAVGCSLKGRRTDANGVRKDKSDLPYEQRVELVKQPNKANCLTTVSKDSMVCDRVGKTELTHIFTVSDGKTTSNLGRTYPIDLPDGEWGIRAFTVAEYARLQTLPADYLGEDISVSKAAKVCGNGWTVDVIAHIFKGLKI